MSVIIDYSISAPLTVDKMPKEFRDIVTPSQLHLAPRAGYRYIPRFDASTNKCWWEWYPTIKERQEDGWVTPQFGSGYHRRRKEWLRRKDDQNAEEKIMGEELFMNGEEQPEETPKEIDQDLEQAQSFAWEKLHEENRRRSRLAAEWREKNNSK